PGKEKIKTLFCEYFEENHQNAESINDIAAVSLHSFIYTDRPHLDDGIFHDRIIPRYSTETKDAKLSLVGVKMDRHFAL
ncbi:hypothetical protein ACXWO5_10970, partial [Streptococcus pyogenes]